ncbi:MAG: hypothetical protein KKE20_02670 [Nanoarchaeota archaeon]|nr:hypothetical protein [Nanoarchaeota archaeon]
MEIILVRYSEIALKGKNRINFENKLKYNMIDSVQGSIRKIPGRFIIIPQNIAKAVQSLRKVFGIASISIAKEIELDIDAIKQECLNQALNKEFSTFRITAQRSQKRLKPSPEIEREIGAFIVEKTGKKVKLKKPDLEISIEISDKAYVFTEKISCVGGLPAGIEGKVILLVENQDSILAGLLAMRRGCDIIPVSFKKSDISLLSNYGCLKELVLIKDLKDIESLAAKKRCTALITNHDLNSTKDIDLSLPVLRPLVGISPKKAKEMLKITDQYNQLT